LVRFKINYLSKNEFLILNFIAKFGYVEESHIIIFSQLSKNYCQKILRQLVILELIIREKILNNRDHYLYLTKNGAKLLQIKTIAKPILHTLLHDSLLVELYLSLVNFNPNWIIQSDKELKRSNNRVISNKFRLPDLLINQQIAIELELSQKSDIRLNEILHNYIIDNNYSMVIYIVKNLAIMNKIKAIIDNLSDKFYFYLLDDNLNVNSLKLCGNNQLALFDLIMYLPVSSIDEKFGNFSYIKVGRYN
jgi:hypothetical protein